MARRTVEALGAGRNGNEIHLRTSDFTAGKYTDVPGWDSVVVGEEAWAVIGN